MARVIPGAVQAYRPTAVEPRSTPIAPPQRIGALADKLPVVRYRRGKGVKQRLNDGVLTA